MIRLIKTDSNNADFRFLVKQLDAYLAIIDGDDHSFYNQFNKIDELKNAIVAYMDDKPVACGAIKEYSGTAMEVKRMFTLPEARGKGLALQVLSELENWAKQSGYQTCVLETGIRQPEAIALYKKTGYKRIANYGQYIGVETSVCFEKEVI